MQAFPHSDYDTALNGDPNQPPVAPMTGLQITMSREIGGWPLYTIVIAMGQVSILFNNGGQLIKCVLDAQRHEFPNYSADWS